MFEEATILAASILHRVLCTPFEDAIDDVQSDEILVSASMVFIQSMKQLKRFVIVILRNVVTDLYNPKIFNCQAITNCGMELTTHF